MDRSLSVEEDDENLVVSAHAFAISGKDLPTRITALVGRDHRIRSFEEVEKWI